ncbi:L-threonine 3-dehydrogenase [Acidimicrobiaceae bacterium AH-315-P05]|nr:L-threonine 3-dehydrogenase [Acidimicrobiaceae bacterium AH-315-P05]
MTELMRALVKSEAAEGLRMENRPIPEIGPDDVLIKIHKTGICGTDVHIWNWDDWARLTVPVGLIIGHEFVGEVVEIGGEVQDVSIGQRCSGEGHLVGRESRQVRAGRLHHDPDTRGIGVNVPGAFAEYLRLPAFNVVPLPDAIPDDVGAILDPLGNAVHAALSFNLLGEDVLVTGAGPIGIMAAAVAKHAGARHVVITDVNQLRLDLAAVVADVEPVNVATTELSEVTQKLGLRQGFDVGLEMSGNSAGFDQMVEAMVMGGRIAMLGIPPGKSQVDWSRIVFKALTIKGVYGREIFETWYKMIIMIEDGLDISQVITQRLSADRFEQGFETTRSGDSGKVVLDWSI